MNHLEGTFKGEQNLKIYHQAWIPLGEIKAAVLIVHGLGEHSWRYPHLVNHLVSQGYALYGFDLPGHGKSGGKRVFVKQFDDYTRTLTLFLKMVKEWSSEKPVFLVGHSMGGLIACYYLLEHSDEFNGAVISAPAVTVPENISQVTIIIGKILSKLVPKLGMMQLDVNEVSRDPDVVQDYLDDPLVFTGKIPVRLTIEMLKAMIRVNHEMEKIDLPILLVQGSEDKMAPPAGAKKLHQQTGSADKTFKLYEGLYHSVFNEPEHEQVLDDVVAWLDVRI